MGLANPTVLIDSKSLFELPVGLSNPKVFIDSKIIFELPVGLATPRFSLIESSFIGTRFIVRNVLWLLRTLRVFVYGKSMPKLRFLMGVKNPNDIL